MVLQRASFCSLNYWVTSAIYTCTTSAHSSVDGHLVPLHALVIADAALSIGVRVSFWIRVLSGYVPRSRIAGSYRSSIFRFLGILHTVFHSGCTDFHSHQQCGRAPFPPHPLQQLFPAGSLRMAVLTSVRGPLTDAALWRRFSDWPAPRLRHCVLMGPLPGAHLSGLFFFSYEDTSPVGLGPYP